MIRIALAQFGLETNSFAPGVTVITDFDPKGFTAAYQVEKLYRGTRTNMGGALQAIADEGAAVVTTDILVNQGNFMGAAQMSDDGLHEVMDHICRELAEKKGQYDGLFFALHGAGASETVDDMESYCLRRVREIVGDMPITSSLDLHGNITEEMLELSDGLFGIKENPHTDIYDAAYLATKTLIRMLRGEVHPQMALRRIPLLISPAVGSTLSGPAHKTKLHFANYAKEHNLIDATFFHGFSNTDRACSSASVLTMANGYIPEQEAGELAGYVWSHRKDFAPPAHSASEAVDIALSMVKDGYVVINEGSDNPGSGCPGDSTHLLREFLRRDLPRSIMGLICDPAAAAECHRHKIGDSFPLEVGGHSVPVCGEPIRLDSVELMGLSDGTYVSVSPIMEGMTVELGPTARLRKGNVEFVVSTQRLQVFDDLPYRITGAKMEDYSIVGLKSMNHFRGYFAGIADGIIAADTPGLRPAVLTNTPYKHLIRPIYPLDEDTVYDGIWPK